MPKESLHQLQTEIEKTDITNPHQSAYVYDLQTHINQSMESPDHHPTLIDELEKGLILFDKDHPDLARAIRSAINILSKGGV